MAQAVVNLSYIGAGPTAGGQTVADQTSGPKAKTLYGYGTLVASSGTFTSELVSKVNFIDGTQGFGQTVRLNLQSVAAPVTLAGVANQAFYASVQGVNSLATGQSVTISGFTTSANNVTATVNTITSSGFYVTNSSAVAETNPAGTAVQTKNAIPAFVDVFVAGSAGDSAGAVAAVGAATIFASGVSATSFNLNHASLATTGAAVTIGAIIAFSS